jgi:hypothetical protein
MPERRHVCATVGWPPRLYRHHALYSIIDGVTMAAVSVGVRPHEAPLPPPEHVVWRLVRNGHELRAVLRAQPEGVELRQMLDSQVVLRSQLFFLTDVGQAIDEAVTQALELWLSRGWTRVE